MAGLTAPGMVAANGAARRETGGACMVVRTRTANTERGAGKH